MADDALLIDYDALREAETALRARLPRAPRMRDAAESLGVPEAALLEARRAVGAARRLSRPEGAEGYGGLLSPLHAAGELMALTRNAHCVHEKKGTYAPPSFHGAMGQCLGEIDLRLFTRGWASAYALEEAPEAGPRLSLQIFDACGEAVHKVYPTAATDRAAFAAILDAAADPDAPEARFLRRGAPAADRPDAEIDAAALRADWAALSHSHEFHGLLRRHAVGRAQALRLAGTEFARPVAAAMVHAALAEASRAGIPVMVFAGNDHCVQIHSGPVDRIERMGPWLNVLDPRFNLHLREDRIAAAYLVRKPSTGGEVHSIELYAGDGALIVQIFGERLSGQAERADWRALVRALGDAHGLEAAA